jgi:hypothetical protein
MHTETNALLAEDCPRWLWKQWMNVMWLLRSGIPILGFTWYSLIHQVDWDIARAEKRGKVKGCGLFDLERRPMTIGNQHPAGAALVVSAQSAQVGHSSPTDGRRFGCPD